MKYNSITAARLRLTQQILMAATESSPRLLEDEFWQRAMCATAALVAKMEINQPHRQIATLRKLEEKCEQRVKK
jgi:hypothetical protein